jgi:hypothetical protein
MKSPTRAILAAALLGCLGACSTIVEGTSQTIQINTIPSEAKCDLFREGAVIGTVASTPGSMTVKKNKQNIMVKCEKDGYQQASFNNKSDFAGATAGNLLLGGFIGVAVDAASGAANKYDGDVTITLQPEPAVAPAVADNAASKPTS